MKNQPINQLDLQLDLGDLPEYLQNCGLWGEFPHRGVGPSSPHREMQDIWVRYNDPRLLDGADPSKFHEEHNAIWLKNIPKIKEISYQVLQYLEGSRLGGVLVTRLPPGGQIYPHIDGGWHAGYYDKYWVPIINDPGAKFCFEGVEVGGNPGEVWAFRNDVPHWVKNDSQNVRISMILCIKQDLLSREGLCLGDTQ